jgi:anaerobic magnesium-protoporphyrin IX monomethyl ester cyclase
VHGMIEIPARWRLDHHLYGFPVELWIKDLANRLVEPPKSKVDAHMLETEVVTC